MKTPVQLAEEYVAHNRSYPYNPLNAQDRYMRNSYLVGYQAAKPQWISVQERLPEIVPTQGMNYWLTSTCVLIATKEKTTHVAHLTHWTREPEADWAACACDTPGHDVEPERWKLSEVTHWMPLPEPPKEEK